MEAEEGERGGLSQDYMRFPRKIQRKSLRENTGDRKTQYMSVESTDKKVQLSPRPCKVA